MGLAVGGAVAAAGVIGVKTAAQMETARIGFSTMLGSAQKADSFLRDLQKFAASTPFEFPELQTAASSLISAGIEAKNVIPIMTSLGNATSGMGTGAEGVQRATVALQQMNAAGKISAEDLNQLRDAGIPVYDLLASAMGKPKEEVAQLAANGKLGKDALDKMMGALESGKGLERFSGLMDKQSASLSGLWSTLKDTVSMGLAQAVMPLMPVLKDGLGWLATNLPGIIGGAMSFGRSLRQDVWPILQQVGGEVRERLAPILARVFAFIRDDGLPAFRRISDVVRADFMPAVRAVGGFLSDTVQPALRKVGDFLVTTFTPAVHEVGESFTKNVLPALGFLRDELERNGPQLKALAKFIGEVVVVVGILTGKIAGFLLPIITDLAGYFVGGMFQAIGVLIGAIGSVVSAFQGMGSTVSSLWSGIIRPTFKFIIDTWMTVVGGIIDGAARAFGWMPEIGGKLKAAAATFDGFRDDVNASLDGLKDKTINVTAITGTSGNVQAGNAGAAFHAAGGAIYGPGSGTSDSIPAMLSNGEHVWTAAEVQRAGGHQAVYAMRAAVRRYAVGGAVDVGVNAQANAAPITSGLASWYSGVVSNVAAAGQKAAAAAASVGAAGGAARWAPVVAQVVGLLGGPAGAVAGILALINKESGGNPNAINLTDSNARAGHPSQGLMQTIPTTFAAYAGPYISRGITDGFANVYAGTNYAAHTYGWGMLAAGGRHNASGGYLGYDSGGIAAGKGLMAKNVIAPERVLSPRQTEAFDRLVQVLDQGGMPSVQGVSVDMGGVTLVNSQATPDELARSLHWALS